MKIQLIVTACLLGLGACTTPDRVDFGGTSYVQAVSGPSQPCETANLRRQSRAELVYPPSLMAIAYANQSRGFSYTVPLTFDVTPEGRAVNVRFAGNPADTTTPPNARPSSTPLNPCRATNSPGPLAARPVTH